MQILPSFLCLFLRFSLLYLLLVRFFLFISWRITILIALTAWFFKTTRFLTWVILDLYICQFFKIWRLFAIYLLFFNLWYIFIRIEGIFIGILILYMKIFLDTFFRGVWARIWEYFNLFNLVCVDLIFVKY